MWNICFGNLIKDKYIDFGNWLKELRNKVKENGGGGCLIVK